MPSATLTSDETEHDVVRRQIFNQILYMNKGLRRGVNPDLGSIGSEEYDLVRYFLAKDKLYSMLERRGRRCPSAADEADSRRFIFEDVIMDLLESGSLYFLTFTDSSGMWSLKVSAIDEHRRAGRHGKRRSICFNDGSFHGRPRRDRKRLPQQIAA